MFPYCILRNVKRVTKHHIRHKNSPDHWSVVRKNVHPVDKALTHFDDFYKQVFDKKWPSIREGLLGKQKYVAIVNNYGDVKEYIEALQLNGAINMRTLFNLEKQHIQEEIAKKKKSKLLNNVFRMEKLMNEQSQEEGENTTIHNNGGHSLESSLDNAEYDERRLVDSKHILSTEILHEFVPATRIKGKEDFIPESSHYKLYDTNTKFSVQIEREYDIHFPEHLNIYCYESDNDNDFVSPKKSSTGVLNSYLMNGGSVLPVLALDLRPGHKLLDMCAAPGGKSLLALQMLYLDSVVSNDVSKSRLYRVENVYKQFLYDFEERWLNTGQVKLTKIDGRMILEDNFDRILVDVPCTTDRISLHENDNNIFKPTRIKERLQLPELQKELLFHALKLVKKGGIVVYSTCSLSPIQNDGVVHMALKQIWEETKSNIIVKDLSPALLQTRSVFEYADKKLLRYGHLILPCQSQNYGPTYFCKLQKIK